MNRKFIVKKSLWFLSELNPKSNEGILISKTANLKTIQVIINTNEYIKKN